MDQETFNAIATQKLWMHTTYIDPVALFILAVAVLMLIMVPRKFAAWPMFMIACFVTQAQRFSLGGCDFPFLRIMAILAIIRILLREEYKGFKWNTLDKVILFFNGLKCAYAVLKITKSSNTSPAGVCADSLDALGQYFLFRCCIRDFDDLKTTAYGLMIIAIPNSIGFIIEYTTLHNPFFFMGGVSDVTRSRDNTLRVMNAYSHPILAGCFWAVLLPYMGACIKQKGSIKFFPFFGIAAASIMIILSGSSTPIGAAGLAFLGGCAFLIRKHIRAIRWSFIIMALGIQLMSNNPIWHVFARVHIIGGSTGYYRFKLIDQFVKHFSQWWLAGSSTGTTTWDVPMFDIVNYYVVLGLGGGLIFVIIMFVMLYYAFKNAGDGVKSAGSDTEKGLFAWATGVSIFCHAMCFLAVTYYGQITMVWYFSLAMTSVVGRGAARQGFNSLTGWQSDPLSRLAAQRSPAYRQPARLGQSV